MDGSIDANRSASGLAGQLMGISSFLHATTATIEGIRLT
jgi:hypothetical protein